jgi:hypothetical protein
MENFKLVRINALYSCREHSERDIRYFRRAVHGSDSKALIEYTGARECTPVEDESYASNLQAIKSGELRKRSWLVKLVERPSILEGKHVAEAEKRVTTEATCEFGNPIQVSGRENAIVIREDEYVPGGPRDADVTVT